MPTRVRPDQRGQVAVRLTDGRTVRRRNRQARRCEHATEQVGAVLAGRIEQTLDRPEQTNRSAVARKTVVVMVLGTSDGVVFRLRTSVLLGRRCAGMSLLAAVWAARAILRLSARTVVMLDHDTNCREPSTYGTRRREAQDQNDDQRASRKQNHTHERTLTDDPGSVKALRRDTPTLAEYRPRERSAEVRPLPEPVSNDRKSSAVRGCCRRRT